MSESNSVFEQPKLWDIYKPEQVGYFQNMEGKTYLDIDGTGGGKEPVVFGHTKRNNENQLWHCLTYGQKKTVLLYNKASNRIIVATGHNEQVACPVATEETVRDEGSHWQMEWVEYDGRTRPARFWNLKHKCVLDLAEGSRHDGTLVYGWEQHWHAMPRDRIGNKSQNQLWKYFPEVGTRP